MSWPAFELTEKCQDNPLASSGYLSVIEGCFRNRRFPVEMLHVDSIYENQIETFSRVWKQKIDSRYSHPRTAPSLLNPTTPNWEDKMWTARKPIVSWLRSTPTTKRFLKKRKLRITIRNRHNVIGRCEVRRIWSNEVSCKARVRRPEGQGSEPIAGFALPWLIASLKPHVPTYSGKRTWLS